MSMSDPYGKHTTLKCPCRAMVRIHIYTFLLEVFFATRRLCWKRKMLCLSWASTEEAAVAVEEMISVHGFLFFSITYGTWYQCIGIRSSTTGLAYSQHHGKNSRVSRRQREAVVAFSAPPMDECFWTLRIVILPPPPSCR